MAVQEAAAEASCDSSTGEHARYEQQEWHLHGSSSRLVPVQEPLQLDGVSKSSGFAMALEVCDRLNTAELVSN
jgi:hypothetical protein